MSSFARYAVQQQDGTRPALALVTGGRSGIGKAIASKIATFPFVEKVLIVSRTIAPEGVADNDKFVAVRADIGTVEGRNKVVAEVDRLAQNQDPQNTERRQLRFLVHSAGTIDPIKPILQVQPEEFRRALTVNLEGPFFLSTALYEYMAAPDETAMAGRILHVSSGAAHGAPPVGWAVYGITKAAFFQSFKVLDRELGQVGSGKAKVRVGSFKPGVVDTSMQGSIREASTEAMPIVKNFQKMKEMVIDKADVSTARPPPKGALDSPENVAFFAEWLLLGTTDDEFANSDDSNEYDIRNETLFPNWIPEENLPKEE